MYDLYDYLAKLRQEAISKYMDYVRREQRAISDGDIGIYIDADPNSDAGKFGATTHDGYSATYAVQAPDEYNTEIPCPNAFGSFPLD